MLTRLLIDTDVLIDYLRDQADAVNYLEGLTDPLLMSVITLAELYAGVREGEERAKLEEFVKAFELISVSSEIAQKGGLFRRDHFKRFNVGLADALIAATAESQQATLVTLNRKHFPMLDEVFVPYQKA
jgi:predicted nucleic acid-binding protein